MSAPPRLFYWTEMFWPRIGGIETFSAALLPRLAARGYAVDVLTGDQDGALPDFEVVDGVRVHRLPLRAAVGAGDPGLMLETIGRVRRLKQEVAADILHLNFSGPMAFFHMRTAAAGAVSLLTSFHNTTDRIRAAGSVVADLLERSDWFTANSRMVLADFLRVRPEAAARTSLVYCGAEPPREVTAMDTASPPRLLFVGRLIAAKGADLAIEAFAALRGRFPGARLVIAGDGEERPALEAQAAALGIAADVDFLGWVRPAGVAALMAAATLVMMPCRWREPFGLVAVEAALQCRPVLGTAGGGLAEVIDDGVTGRLVPRGDGPALASAAAALLADREALAVMGLRARDRAIRLFSLAAAADSFDALYRRLAVRR